MTSPRPFYVVKQEAGDLFLVILSLYDKSEEEVSFYCLNGVRISPF
jgi:hypothetical protein